MKAYSVNSHSWHVWFYTAFGSDLPTALDPDYEYGYGKPWPSQPPPLDFCTYFQRVFRNLLGVLALVVLVFFLSVSMVVWPIFLVLSTYGEHLGWHWFINLVNMALNEKMNWLGLSFAVWTISCAFLFFCAVLEHAPVFFKPLIRLIFHVVLWPWRTYRYFVPKPDEEHVGFVQTAFRSWNGRYCVPIQFKDSKESQIRNSWKEMP